MKILIIINNEYFRNRALELLFSNFPEHSFKVLKNKYKNKKFDSLKTKFSFWGLKGIVKLSVLMISNIIFNFLFSFSYKTYLFRADKICELYKIDYKTVPSINCNKTKKLIKDYNPDVLLSYQSQIINDSILKIPKLYSINCHQAYLPSYRGRKPVFWAMLNNEDQYGVAVHTLSSRIDSGIILNKKKIPLDLSLSYYENVLKISSLSNLCILETVDSIVNKAFDNNSLDKISKSEKYYGEPTKEDIKKFKRKYRLI